MGRVEGLDKMASGVRNGIMMDGMPTEWSFDGSIVQSSTIAL